MKKKLKATLAAVSLALVVMFTGAQAATAACYYAAPTTGDHVTYYNCRGPYVYNAYSSYRAWECYADWDWYAEWFWGKHDGYTVGYAGMSCYA